MNANELNQTEELTRSGIALVVIQLFRLLFGGYLIGFDMYYYNDMESALSVLLIYVVVGIFTSLFFTSRKRSGLFGLIALSVILIIMQSIYIIVYFSQPTPDPSWHNPFTNLWTSVLNYAFPILTLVFAKKEYSQ
jgi:UDP-N-acetylmuramyl pentapeptide phosphotransferase/UDP-N-acetylglucosamine-1-phosphate transferase